MHVKRVAAVLALVSVVSACAHPASSMAPRDEAGERKLGEIRLRRGTAAFNAERVWGPSVDLSRQADGSWRGVMHGWPFSVVVTPGRIVGYAIDLTYEQTEFGLVIEGSAYGRPLEYLYLPGREFAGNYLGAAAAPNPPMPQFILAVFGARGRAWSKRPIIVDTIRPNYP